MSRTHALVNVTFRRIVRILCRVDDSAWAKVPATGPLILAVNHINFMDAPAMYTHLMPRPITGFVKAENWERPFTRWLFTLWNGIPLHRGEADLAAFRLGLAALEQGKILTIAPEGTRTGDGRLRRGQPGIALMALKASAPILPAAFHGNEAFWQNVRRLRRTPFHLRVGRPFHLDPGTERVSRSVRQAMVDQIMFQIAAMLPPELRGQYANLERASTNFLRFQAE